MRNLMLLTLLAAQLMSADGDISSARMPDIVLDAIKHCECLKESNGVCNPNVIRINADEDARRAQVAGFAVNGHIIRCNATEECAAQAQALVNGGITNLDLGPYQINYKYHPNPMLQEYFIDASERESANKIMMSLVKSFGYSWETLGRYHHFSATDRTRNEIYYRKMYAFIYGNSPKVASVEQ